MRIRSYMIVQYLMRSSQSKSVTLEIFTNARPPGIKKDKHVQGLYCFYNEKRTNNSVPSIPAWKRSVQALLLAR
uniref:mRNA capping enzyme family protein n=1 Tax=Citrus limon TaxID=2708 RepID=A0A1S8ACM6_CITLI